MIILRYFLCINFYFHILASVEEINKSVAKLKITEPPVPQPDPAKRLKNLRKRLFEILKLEVKITTGELKNPEKDQLDKVARKLQVMNEIQALEDSIKANEA